MVRNPDRIQEWFGECLARNTHGAGRAGLEVLSSEFWVLSYPEVLKDTCRALSENQKLRTQNSELPSDSAFTTAWLVLSHRSSRLSA